MKVVIEAIGGRSLVSCFAMATLLFSGCQPAATTNKPLAAVPKEDTKTIEVADAELNTDEVADQGHPSVGAAFEPPIRIRAGGELVSVESPGYACPTMADVDGDGREDLVVGQFNQGNLQFCKNISKDGELPKFAKASWMKSGDERITVPGVW